MRGNTLWQLRPRIPVAARTAEEGASGTGYRADALLLHQNSGFEQSYPAISDGIDLTGGDNPPEGSLASWETIPRSV